MIVVSQGAGALCADRDAARAVPPHDGRGVGHSTPRSLGATPAFFATWPAAWVLSWLVGFPTLLLALPMVRQIVTLVVAAPPQPGR